MYCNKSHPRLLIIYIISHHPMKTFIAVLFALLCSTTFAQITLEHEIPDSNAFFSLIQVDSGEYYYMTRVFTDSNQKYTPREIDIKLYDLDFNLVKTLDVAKYLSAPPSNDAISYITRRLFDLDDSIEYLFAKFNGPVPSVRIVKESGTLIFACDSCSMGYEAEHHDDFFERGIYNTPKGVKMLIYHFNTFTRPIDLINRIYSLPGKLPTSSVASEDISYIQSALDIEAIPNPASDRIQINYHLPAGMLSGYITIRDTKGAELQTHPLNYTEGSISIDVRYLSPGSYYCCLLTSDGRTTVKKMMVVR
jgi:hypothetical protein